MRYPDFLKKNGRIGFIAPSFGCTTEPYRSQFDSALIKFREDGYRTILGPNCFADCGIGKSNTPERCAEEINRFFGDDRSDVIISCGGGETMCEDLGFVDFKTIAESKAKWYMGYSDNTNLTFLLNTLCDTASIYGPNAPKFGSEDMHPSVTDAYELLKGNSLSFHNYDGWYEEIKPEEEASEELTGSADTAEVGSVNSHDEEVERYIAGRRYKIIPYKQHIFMGNEKADDVSFNGRIVGGCMDCLVNLVGTGFDKVSDFCDRYSDDGIIWFMEACDFNVMDIRRALWQMENAGWFKNLKGFIIGRPMNFYDTFGDFDHIEAVRGILGKYNVPMVMDIDLGHLFPAMPIVSGAIANINAHDNEIKITYELR